MLTKPPFVSEGFVGRKEELRVMKDKLFGGNSLLLLVNGEGGIGKTSLASKYFHTYQEEYAHAARVLSEKNIANVLLLSLPGPLGMQFEETTPADERFDQLLTAMAQLNTPCLLVIDNANEVDDLEKNYIHLRRCQNFHVMLTTRITEFSQAACYKIEGLPEALQLFRKHYPGHKESEDALFKHIRTAVGGNTLVIELLAKSLHSFNRLKTTYSLASLLADLQNKGLLALRQSHAVITDYHSKGSMRKERPEDIIAAMYDLSQLQPGETALLSVFAVLPAENIGFEMMETLLSHKEGVDQKLLALAQKGWIEHNETSPSFKCSSVVQEITKKKNPQLFEDCRTLSDTLIEKLLYEPGTGHLLNATYEEAAVFARYAESVVRSFSVAEDSVAILCERIGSYYRTTGNLDKALGFFEEETDLFKELYEAYPTNVSFKNGLALSYLWLGWVYEKAENKKKAKECYVLSKELLTPLVKSFPAYVEFKKNLDWVENKISEQE